MPEPLPWSLLRTRAERDFRIFSARTLDVADPRTKTEYVRTVLVCPDWVNVVAVTEDEQVVLVRQFRFGTWSNTLEIPGGIMDATDTHAQVAAARELEEETGFVAGSIQLLGRSHPNPAIQTNSLHTFLALNCQRRHAGRPDGTEDIEVVLVPKGQIRELIQNGAITHSLVLAAFALDASGPRAVI